MNKRDQAKFEKLFDQTLDMPDNESFLAALSDLIFEMTGNVNLRMRLFKISEKLKRRRKSA